MSNRISYLLGAGASANALPIVSQMTERLSTWQGSLIPGFIAEFGENVLAGQNGETVGDGLNAIQADLQWVLEQSVNILTIDTLAKKFYLTRDSESLMRLKGALSIFFLLEQIRQPVDLRYDSFWASVLDGELEQFAENSRLNIVTWNYDSQIEKSLLKFTDNRTVDYLHEVLQITPFQNTDKFDPKRFSVIKLNGAAGIHDSTQGTQKLRFWRNSGFNQEIVTAIANFYYAFSAQPEFLHPWLSFAWEGNTPANLARQQAMAACSNSEVLVIIGYSFPFFNRKIDSELLKSMKQLRRVYIQVSAEDGVAIRERFQTFRPDITNITTIADQKQFYIPYEY